MRKNNLNSNSTEAIRILLAIEIILNPSSITLPSLPSTVAAKKYLSINNNSNNNNMSSLSFSTSNLLDISSNKDQNMKEKEDSLEEKNIPSAKGAFLEGKNEGRERVKRGRDEENEGTENKDDEVTRKKIRQDEINTSSIGENVGKAFGKQNNNDKKVDTNVNNDDDDEDDDDDSLPDIDIQADPEQ